MPDCILHTLRNQRRVDVTAVCARERVVLASLASEQLGQVWLSPTGEFVAFQAPSEIRIVAVSGGLLHRAPLAGHNSTLAWLDRTRVLSFGGDGPRIHLTSGEIQPFESCDPSATPALVIREANGSVTILDERGAAWVPLVATFAELQDEISRIQTVSGDADIVTKHGQGYTAKGFSQWVSEAANLAGLPPAASAHGLRKAAARRLAEAGCSAHMIMSVTGHRSLKEVERYTRAAGQRLLATSAMQRIART